MGGGVKVVCLLLLLLLQLRGRWGKGGMVLRWSRKLPLRRRAGCGGDGEGGGMAAAAAALAVVRCQRLAWPATGAPFGTKRQRNATRGGSGASVQSPRLEGVLLPPAYPEVVAARVR